MGKTIEQAFSDMVTLLRFNYGAGYYPKEFVKELFKVVMDVDPVFFEKEIKAHMRFHEETKDRPKMAAFARIRRDWLASQQKQPKPEPFVKGTLNLHGAKDAVDLLEKINSGEIVLPESEDK